MKLVIFCIDTVHNGTVESGNVSIHVNVKIQNWGIEMSEIKD